MKNVKLQLIDLLIEKKISIISINKLMGVGKIIVVKKNTKLIAVGDVCDKGFYVLDGAFISRIFNVQTGNSGTQNFFLPDFNQFMSCEDSYFTGEKTNTDLIAVKDSTVIQFLKSDFEQLFLTNHELASFFHNHIIVNALRQESEFRKILNAYSKEEIYKYLIEFCNPIVKNIPSKYIAEFMGISAEWLSKTKKNI
jgi:hypothetical protein